MVVPRVPGSVWISGLHHSVFYNRMCAHLPSHSRSWCWEARFFINNLHFTDVGLEAQKRRRG